MWVASQRRSFICTNAGAVRLNYVRNDLLAFTSSATDLRDIYRSLRVLILSTFSIRATAADLVVLGIGQHFPPMVETLLAHASPRPQAARDAATLALSHIFLNESLTSLARARAASGKQSGSVVLVGSNVAVPNCSLYEVPADHEAAGAADYAAGPQEDKRYRYMHSCRSTAEEALLSRPPRRGLMGCRPPRRSLMGCNRTANVT